MSSLHSLQKHPGKAGKVTFNRNELRVLLDEYSRRVAAGEWRDYAIDMLADRAVFSVFRHTAEHPLYAIEKLGPKAARTGQYRLFRGPERLKQAARLEDVIAAIERRPRLAFSR